MRDGVKRCKFCGKEIGIITYGIYRKCVVDAEAVTVIAAPDGDEYIRVDGTKVKAKEIPYDADAEGAKPAYRPHRWSCGG